MKYEKGKIEYKKITYKIDYRVIELIKSIREHKQVSQQKVVNECLNIGLNHYLK